MKKGMYLSGALASLLYIVAVIVGGILWPGYSHIRQSISELTMTNSPVVKQVGWMFALYNYLLLVFGVGMVGIWWKRNKLLAVSGIFLAVCSFAGIGMLSATQDPLGASLTTKGLIHLILAGVASLTTLLALFLAVFGFARENNRSLKNISLIFATLVLISGPITAMAIPQIPDYFGLIERVTIGSFILWLLLVSGTLLVAERT